MTTFCTGLGIAVLGIAATTAAMFVVTALFLGASEIFSGLFRR